jgi:hypothetical protein
VTSETINEIKGGLARALGVLSTTYGLALAQGLIDLHATWGKLCTLGASVLTAYGFYAGYTYRQRRTPWTNEQKIAESLRRITAGEPPIAGYEFLLVDPTAKAPPLALHPVPTPTMAPPAPPPLPPSPTDEKKGA